METGEAQSCWTIQIHQAELRADIHQVCRSVQENQTGSSSVATVFLFKVETKK